MKNLYKTSVLGLLSLVFLFFLGNTFPVNAQGGTATVTTDKDDYAPGEIAIITGSGWTGDQFVDLHFAEDPFVDHIHDYHDIAVNPDGTFRVEFPILDRHLGVTFTLTAEGKQTGNTAVHVFTDGNVRVKSSRSSANITWYLFSSINCTGSLDADGTGTATTNNGSTFSKPNTNTEKSLRIEAPLLASDGSVFVSWSGPAGEFSVDPSNPRIICIRGTSPSGIQDFIINYLQCTTAPATPGAISRSANECAGSTGNTYSITPVSGATSYTWSVTGTGWAVTAGGSTSSATITIGSGVGTVSVTATNACGTSAASTTGNITPSSAPTVSATNLPTSGTISNTTGSCSASVAFGSNVTATGSPTLIYSLVNGNFSEPNLITSPYVFPVGTTIVYVRATNGCGSAEASFTVTVTDDEDPTIVNLPADVTVSNDAGVCGAVVSWTAPTAADNCAGSTIAQTAGPASGSVFPIGTTTVTYTATDASNNTYSESFTVTVTNAAPSNIVITAPIIPQPLGTAISVSATFVDENIESATWTAFDGNAVVQTFTIPATGNSTSYTFNNLPAGVYSIILELEDYCGLTATQEFQFVTIYDPNGGFVTGGGWIYSKPGDLVTDPTAKGKANFGFVAKYKTGKNLVNQVDGNTNFQFKEGDFHFKSSSHDDMSLVISGAKATYRGIGTVNGLGAHKFMVTVIDGDLRGGTDRFRIRIWANESSSVVIYDNEFSADENAESTTELGGGSIVIHKVVGKGNKRVVTDLVTVPWNTPAEVIENKITAMSSDWFEGKGIKLNINSESYNPLAAGFYEMKVDVQANEWFDLEEPINVNVLVADKPLATDIKLSNSILLRNIHNGSVIGDLKTIDPVDDQHTYSIAENADFELVGKSLVWKGTEIPASARITVFSTDRAGQTIERAIELNREPRIGDFNMFPNPAQSDVNLEVELDQTATVGIRIYDAVGRLVHEQEGVQSGSTSYQITIDHLSPGLYTVQVKTGQLLMNKRLIKK